MKTIPFSEVAEDPKLWIYVTDMVSQGRIMNLRTPELQEVVFPAQVKGGGKIGLRGYILRELDGKKYEETGDKIELTPQVFDQMSANWKPYNSWIYDWPHWPFESTVSDEQLDKLRVTLEDMMKKQPFEHEIVGLSPRMLRYFSDGDIANQGFFVGLAEKPGEHDPYSRLTWDLLPRYKAQWSSADRDKKVPRPVNLATGRQQTGSCLLYEGPAVAVRFLLDGQIAAFEGCRVYVKPSGEFICSDWCQRHDVLSYSNGINLQVGTYTYDGWVASPCAMRAIEHGTFEAKIGLKRHKIQDIIRKEGRPVEVPTFEAAYEKIKAKKDAERNKNLDPMAARVKAAVEADKKYNDAEELIHQIRFEIEEAIEAKTGKGLAGARLLIPVNKVYMAGSTVANKYLANPNEYRLMASYGACAAPITPEKVCIRTPDGTHNHVLVADVKVDWDATKEALANEAYKLVAEVAPVVELTEITADALQLARQLAHEATGKVLDAELEQLKQESLKKAMKMKNVEVKPQDVLPSVEPLSVEYSAPNWDYNCEISRVTPNLVSFNFLLPAGSDIYYVRTSVEDGEITYRFVRNIASRKYEAVDMSSPLGQAVVYYFNDFLPRQLNAQKRAILDSKEFTIDDNSFRAYPVIGGATILKVVDGEISESVTVRRKQNGHIYAVAEDGDTRVMSAGPLKQAAQHFFQNILKVTDVAEVEAAA